MTIFFVTNFHKTIRYCKKKKSLFYQSIQGTEKSVNCFEVANTELQNVVGYQGLNYTKLKRHL